MKSATGTGDDAEDAKEDRVREKLLNARCLEAARNLGLGQGAAELRSFSVSGGMQSFANELVRFLSASAQNHDKRCSVFAEKYKPFCEKFSIDFNESLLHYLKGLCLSTNTTAQSIQECASGEFLALARRFVCLALALYHFIWSTQKAYLYSSVLYLFCSGSML